MYTPCTYCAEGERITSGELEEFIRQVVASGTLQEVGSEVTSQQPKEMLRKAMSLSVSAFEKFLSELSEGTYDSPKPKTKVRSCDSHMILLLRSCDSLMTRYQDPSIMATVPLGNEILSFIEGSGVDLY